MKLEARGEDRDEEDKLNVSFESEEGTGIVLKGKFIKDRSEEPSSVGRVKAKDASEEGKNV